MAADQAIAMDSYQNYFRNRDIFLSRKHQGGKSTDRKIYCVLLYHFFMVVMIFKVATSLLIFSTTGSSLTQQRKQVKSNYTSFYSTWHINLNISFGNHTYPKRAYYQSRKITLFVSFVCLYNSIAIVWNADFPLISPWELFYILML